MPADDLLVDASDGSTAMDVLVSFSATSVSMGSCTGEWVGIKDLWEIDECGAWGDGIANLMSRPTPTD